MASCFLLGVALVCLLGADIAFDPNSPVPNPNNMPLTIEGSGTFKLEKGEKFVGIVFIARDTKTSQDFSNFAQIDFNTMKWNQKLLVNPAGDYECWAEIGLAVPDPKDPNVVIITTKPTPKTTITVK